MTQPPDDLPPQDEEPQDQTGGYGESGAPEPADEAWAAEAPAPVVEEPPLPWDPEDAAAMEPPVAWEPGEGDAWVSDTDEDTDDDADDDTDGTWDVEDDLAPEDELAPNQEWEPALDEAALLSGAEPETEAQVGSTTYSGAYVPLADEPVSTDHWSDEESAQDEEDEPDETYAPPAGEGRGLVTALALLVAALVLLTGWLGYAVADNRGSAPIEKTRASALAAGRDAARLVFSYDYRHLDKDFAAATAVTTGTFKKDYANTTTKLVGDVAPRYKAVLLAEVSDAAVVEASENEVLLLVFLDVQSTSTLAATPKITPRRLKMTMTRVDGHWLVSKVDAF
jgi:Mce-associated membrane protein